MRRRRKPFFQNLDSLLDTLANVVGILVIATVIAIIDLQRMPPLAAKAQQNLTVANDSAEIEDLEAALAALESAQSAARENLPALRLAAQRLRAAAQDQPPAVTNVTTTTPNYARDKAELSARTEDLQKQLAALRQRLSKPAVSVPIKQIRIPNPRVAPEGLEPLYVLCRYGRVHILSEPMRNVLTRALREASGSVAPNTQDPIADLARFFRDHNVGDDNLAWKFSGRELTLRWHNQRVGESPEQISLSNARFRREITAAEKSKRYITYFVWADSFDVYIQARDISDSRGIFAGWEPMEAQEELTVVVGAGSRTRPKRID